MKLIYLSTLLLSTALFASPAIGQALPQKHPGISLYEAGKFADAAASLESAVRTREFKTNAELWNYLGQAQVKLGNYEDATKSLKKAVKLDALSSTFRSNLARSYFLDGDSKRAISETNKALKLDRTNIDAYHIRGMAELRTGKIDAAEADSDMMVSIAPTDTNGYTLKSDVLLARLAIRIDKSEDLADNVGLLNQAYDVLSKGIELSKGQPNRTDIGSRYVALGAFFEYYALDEGTPFPDSSIESYVIPLKIHSAPRAVYTDSARRRSKQGTVKLLALMGLDSKIGPVVLLNRLGFGLDEQVEEAARKIKFEPKIVNGIPVTSVAVIEYQFSIY